ncbi:unnamed protein product [Moneuplotes crassus]|uniref:non-specific serine/threonine protein kinase n=1 Tax=Euplotes crassus TaxID=5936 RepID=A0AAD1X721_EUPCR|nr:unnamed protein product [Moneuplotes crassus]
MGSSNSHKKLRITNCKEIGQAREKLLEKYRISHGVIGEGAFGKVYKGTSIEDSQNKVAIKAFKKKQLFDDDVKSIESEIKVLCQLDHPNIIKYYESFADEGNMYIVTDYIKGQTLSKMLEKVSFALSETEAARVLYQLASALNHCHSKHIMHRDIKPANIMVDTKMHVTLIDFGLSNVFSKKKILRSACGTPSFMSPETITGSYNEKCDVWSFGILMYLLLTGRLPFSGETPRDLLSEALSCQLQLESSLWEDISKDAKNLIKKIISTDVKERYSIQKVLEHPWFDQVRDDSTEDSHSEAELRVLETLAGFTTENKFTKACMRVIASITKMPQDPAISQEFSKIDEKQNAIISKEELRNAFDKKALSLSDKEINAIIGDLNYSGEQHINYTEFCTASMDKYEVLSPKNCKTLFNYFDTDKDGVVTQKDIFLGLEKSGIFTKAQIKAIVKDSGISKAKAFELEEFEELVSF